MYVLDLRREAWQDGYLDYHRPEHCLRIQVKAWRVTQCIPDMYFTQPRDWRRVWNYVRTIGPGLVLRKVRARRAEELRNEKVLAVGLGIIVEPDSRNSLDRGQTVAFVAPGHPPCVERVVLPPDLVVPVDRALFDEVAQEDAILFAEQPVDETRYHALAGWSEYSGEALPESVPALLRDAVRRWEKFDPASSRNLTLPTPSMIRERNAPPADQKTGRLSTVVFGLGNQTKAIILPNVRRALNVSCVHEIDPTQIGSTGNSPWRTDSAPVVRPDEHYDVYLIAGYHHTHTPLAVHALRAGAWAVVEKPLVTTWDQLQSLLEALGESGRRLFGGFHVRYNPLWGWARADLGVEDGEPVHYHCIVFEVPLPARHWYRWPNARSRVVSNACHWIDHFLFLNRFSQPVRYDLWKGRNEDVHISMELENGAVFGMHLTDQGSKRIGLQDHIDLRARGVTVKVENQSRYRSEDDRHILRKGSVNKIAAYEQMYRTICEKIRRGEEGDEIDSIRTTCEAMLRFEDLHASA